MARRSTSLFSLQPSQYGGLSEFARFGADLPRTGSMQDFIDPSLGGGEGLELEPSEDALDPSTIAQTDEGDFYSTSTGTKFNVSEPVRGILEQKTSPTPQDKNEPTFDPVTGAKAATQLVSAGGKLASQLSGLFGDKEPQDTKGFNLRDQGTDWTSPEAVASWLQSNPQEQLSLWAQEFGQTPEDVVRMIGTEGFDLGADTQFDSSFLDQFGGGVSPTTGTQTGGTISPQALLSAASTAGSAAGAVIAALKAAGISNETTQSIERLLGGAGQIATLVKATQGGPLPSIFGGGAALAGDLSDAAAESVANALLGGTTEGVAELLESSGVLEGALANAGTVIAIVKALFDIAMVASSGNMSDEEKAIQATKVATKAAAAILAPATFGASLAVMQIWDFVDNMRMGRPLGESLVRANDPSGLLGEEASLSRRIFEPSKQWMSFVPELYQNAGQQAKAFSVLQSALPYVQSKEELGNLINSYKNYVQTTTGIQLTDAVNDPYTIAAIPGVGPRTHGQATQPVDWSAPQTALQNQINAMLEILPGERITAVYGQPGGGLEDLEERVRLWDQFIPGGGSELLPDYGVTRTQLDELFGPYYQNYGRTPIDTQSVLSRFNTYRAPGIARYQQQLADEEARARAWYEEIQNQSVGGGGAGVGGDSGF